MCGVTADGRHGRCASRKVRDLIRIDRRHSSIAHMELPVAGLFTGPTEAEWAVNMQHMTTQMLPKLITARHIRLVIETIGHSWMAAMRAGVLKVRAV